MSSTHGETKPMTDAGSATSGRRFLPAPAYTMPIDRLLIGVLSLTPVTIIEIVKLLRAVLRKKSASQPRSYLFP